MYLVHLATSGHCCSITYTYSFTWADQYNYKIYIHYVHGYEIQRRIKVIEKHIICVNNENIKRVMTQKHPCLF
jgi:hypothetical protein